MKTLVSLMTLLVMFSLPVHAGSPFRAIELSDVELSELRGRYVMPGRIIHFGVTMSSEWKNSAGQSLGAQVNLQVNSRAQPSLQITDLSSQSADNGNAPALSGSGLVVGGDGLQQVSGISQSVRSAGDFNDALNNLDIVVSRDGQFAASASAGGSPSGSRSFTNDVGSVRVDAQGGLKILLDAGAQGSAMQQIGSGNVVQQANFTGDLNNVRNLATLNVALKDLPLGQDFANCTLEQLRALRPMGF